jgi:hypothetical protein
MHLRELHVSMVKFSLENKGFEQLLPYQEI